MIEWGIVFVVSLLIIYLIFRSRTKTEELRNPNNVFSNLYFDNNGTTQPHAGVLVAMRNAAYLGNPSAGYSSTANDIINTLKARIHNWTNTSPKTHGIIINSGASEGNNYVIRGVVDKYWRDQISFSRPDTEVLVPHIIISATEHKTSIGCVDDLVQLRRCTVTYIAPRETGVISANDVAEVIVPQTVLITVMHANNEIGNKNDISAIGRLARSRGILFHSDCTQTFGKYAIPVEEYGVDIITASFHKMYGPNGIGIVLYNNAAILEAQISGSQNNGLRGGTENMQAIAGASAAMPITLHDREYKNNLLRAMKAQIVNCFIHNFNIDKFMNYFGKDDSTIPGPLKDAKFPLSVMFLGPVDSKGLPVETMGAYGDSIISGVLPNTLLVSFNRVVVDPTSYKNFCNLKLKKELADHNVVVSIGSACNTKETGPSHVLKAIRAPYIVRCGVIRITLGDYNTPAQVKKLCEILVRSAYLQA